MATTHDRDPLLPNAASARTYGVVPHVTDEENAKLFKKIADGDQRASILSTNSMAAADQPGSKSGPIRFLYYIVYALVYV